MFNPVLAEWIAADHIAERHSEAAEWRRTRAPRTVPVHRVGLRPRLRRSLTAWRVSLGLLGRPRAVGCETC